MPKRATPLTAPWWVCMKTATSVWPPAKSTNSWAASSELHRSGDFAAKLGDSIMLPLPQGSVTGRLLLIGLGSRAGFGRKQYRKALQSSAQALAKTGTSQAALYLAMEPVAELDMLYRARFIAEVFCSHAYKIPDLKTTARPKPRPLARSTRWPRPTRKGAKAAAAGLEDRRGPWQRP